MLAWRAFRSMARNLRRELFVDDFRTYRGIDLLVVSMHIANIVSSTAKAPRVAVMLPTSGVFAGVASGVWFAGRTLVPLNYLLKSEELQYVIDDCGADLLIASRKLCEHLKLEPKAKHIIWIEDINFKKLPRPRWPKSAGPDDLAVMLYTSGTSGRPKGVMLTHKNLLSNVRQTRQHIHFTKEEIFLGVLPQFHSFGLTALTLIPFLSGARAVYQARFVPKQIIEACRKHRPTVFMGLPSMYNALLTVKDATPDDLKSIRIAVSGGEPLPESVAKRFQERFGIQICEGFGMTESAPVTHVRLPDEQAPGSVGRPLPEVKQRIVDPETNKDLPPGQDGELRMSGPNIMKGYHNLPEETAAAFDEEGYLRTGDMARVDERGFLWITGRIKEMIIVGGENVFPREVEEVLDAHEDVFAAGVVGERDDIRGETVVAFVEAEEGKTPDPDALRAWCRERLAGYKVPRRIVVVDKLPRNPTGKIMRRALVERIKEEQAESPKA
ncbi:MAG: AMP-binding protein [Phycisphaerales bacterium]|nr:AMP-binding protein [Planctomycetota bacterium]MCH8507879.1 AMP-binding protein [Phycisphaerales bacterium]